MDNDWNVLWSMAQNALHIEQMDRTIASGMEAMKTNAKRSYVLVAAGLSKEAAEQFCDEWRDVLHVRSIENKAKRPDPFQGAI